MQKKEPYPFKAQGYSCLSVWQALLSVIERDSFNLNSSVESRAHSIIVEGSKNPQVFRGFWALGYEFMDNKPQCAY